MKIIDVNSHENKGTKIIFNTSGSGLNEYIFYEEENYFTIFDEYSGGEVGILCQSIDNLIKALNILKGEMEQK